MGRASTDPSININDSLNRCKEILITFGIFFLPGMLYSPRVTGREFNNPAFLLATTVSGLAQIALILYLLASAGKRDPADYGVRRFTPRAAAGGFLAFLLMVPLFFLLILVAGLLPRDVLVSALPSFRWSYTNYALLPLVAAACFVTGYREELYFRGYLPTEFRACGVPAPAAAAAANLLFALGHLYQGPTGFAVALLLGAFMTAAFRKTGNLHVPAIAHGLYNLTVLLVSGFL